LSKGKKYEQRKTKKGEKMTKVENCQRGKNMNDEKPKGEKMTKVENCQRGKNMNDEKPFFSH
jgi:hypothetical protein